MILPRLKLAIARLVHRYCPRVWLAFRIGRRDRHFEPEFWLIPIFCDRGHVAVDVGANAGEFSYFMKRHAGAVVAFEPNRDLWPALRRLVGTNVRIEAVALSNTSGTASFRYVPTNTGVATVEIRNPLSMIEDPDAIHRRTVELRTLDSFKLERISFIKIDVEGHEEAVVDGAVDTLQRNRPSLLIESEDRHNQGAPARLCTRLSALGYRGFYLDGGDLRELTGSSNQRNYAENLVNSGCGAVNNYIFVPAERSDLLDRLRSVRPPPVESA